VSTQRNRRKNQAGSSVIEMALFFPMFVFLFIGAFDWGIYSHALISIQSAVRVAAVYASASTKTATNSTKACEYVLDELRAAINIGSLSTCTGLPVIVTATMVTGPDGQPACQVAVTYQTTQLIGIPGLLANQATIYRVLQLPVRG
jgi:Flp pilus assembly protein TadG